MARMHSKKKGKSGRKRPKSKTVPEWIDKKREDVEEIILQMSKEGGSPTAIGLALRDQYGIPTLKPLLGMPLTKFLKEKGVLAPYPDDLLLLIRKAVRVREHLKAHGKDRHNKVKLMHVESKIQRLVKYYTRQRRLPANWRYEPEKAALLVK